MNGEEAFSGLWVKHRRWLAKLCNIAIQVYINYYIDQNESTSADDVRLF
jgi:hypothetical protein